jgi:DNA-binding IclR family transcriptional regulator
MTGGTMADELMTPEALRILEFLRRNWLEWFAADHLAYRVGMTPTEALPYIDALRAAEKVEQATTVDRYRASRPRAATIALRG